MIDFASARQTMVDGQVRPHDVTDLRLLAAMLQVPRERFVPPECAALAYLDLDLPVTVPPAGVPPRRLLKPMVLAKLIQAAEIDAQDRVLDVGCATGYSSAVLARLAGSVVALEEDPALARIADANIRALGLRNVTVVTGRMRDGWAAQAPYAAILLNGATEVAPKALLHQLSEGGRLVDIMGCGPAGKATLYYSSGGDVGGRTIFDAAATVLPGFDAAPAFVF